MSSNKHQLQENKTEHDNNPTIFNNPIIIITIKKLR